MVGFGIRYTLQDSGERVGEEEGGDHLHCFGSAASSSIGTGKFARSSIEVPVRDPTYWKATLALAMRAQHVRIHVAHGYQCRAASCRVGVGITSTRKLKKLAGS